MSENFLFKNFYDWCLGILMENSGSLDLSENIQSGRVFYADSLDTVIVGLPKRVGGVDTKRSWIASLYLGPVFRKSVISFLKFIEQA